MYMLPRLLLIFAIKGLIAQPAHVSGRSDAYNVTRFFHNTQDDVVDEDSHDEFWDVNQIKFVAYSVIAYIVVSMGIIGNLLSLLVLTRPNLKGVMYVYLLGLAVSNLCVLVSAVPALFDISEGFRSGNYATAFYQAHLELPLINSFMASSVYIIICMTVNRYISIHKPTQFQRIHTHKNANISIIACFMGGILLHIPLCFQNTVICKPEEENGNATGINEDEGDLPEPSCVWTSVENEEISESLLFRAYLVVSEILLRFGPIITLAVLNTLIIYRFQKVAQKRQRLKGYSATITASAAGKASSPSSPYPSNVVLNMTGSGDNHTGRTSVSQDGNNSLHPGVIVAANGANGNHHQVLSRQQTLHSGASRRRSLQSPEERMLVLVLISIVVLFVICTTPAAVLSILYSVKLDMHKGFQVFRAVANNLELLNFALNFYIYCLCSADIRRAFMSLFQDVKSLLRGGEVQATDATKP